MKIFLDTEFYEHPPISVDQYGCIHSTPGANAVQLISLGAVREDGAEFYAENADFEWGDIPEDHWLQDNVRPNLRGYVRVGGKAESGRWSVARIAGEFYKFATGGNLYDFDVPQTHKPEFWGYFCDYDWVVLCGLYGRMVDLPPGFPMYCLDLKQEMHRMDVKKDDLPTQSAGHHHALEDARWVKRAYEYMPGDEFSKGEALAPLY